MLATTLGVYLWCVWLCQPVFTRRRHSAGPVVQGIRGMASADGQVVVIDGAGGFLRRVSGASGVGIELLTHRSTVANRVAARCHDHGQPGPPTPSQPASSDASTSRCAYAVLPYAGTGPRASTMFRISVIVIPPHDDGGIANSV